MNNLGLAYRARKLTYGTTNVIKSIRDGSAKLIIIARDASDNTKKKITDKCKYYDIPFKIEFISAEISNAIGKKNIMVVSILDSGFKEMLL
ncbi:MAG: hypothetical protein GX931_04735 [Acholeplasmataceae bacterium]|jgi:ribosomal protein L7Ae-like RNA K-turn-binding protein|nr:hypothetical protein [Acholeplasmataceae bacterium]